MRNDPIYTVVIKGVTYKLFIYKQLRDEYDLTVDGKLVCDSKPKSTCISKILELAED